jgi:glycine cleavage system H protein
MSEWKTISIRQELIKEIEKIIKTGRYRSISEFVSEAIRLRLEELTRAEGFASAKTQETPSTPDQLLYTPKHTWAQTMSDGNVRVGISDYAQRRLRGLAQVRTEPVGRELNKMEPFGVAETWMLLFDLYSPISGRIVKINEKLRDKPMLANEDPYGQGWILEIKPNNSLTLKQELDSLLGAREYGKWVDKLEGRTHEQTE